MEKSSPARLFATLAGGLLVVIGILGFFYDASFDTGKALRSADLLGVVTVNGWQNLFHIATGLLGLACAGYAARQYSLGMGLVYAIVAIWGFAVADHGSGAILDALPVNTEGNLLHLIVGLAGLGAGAATLKAGAARRSATGKAAAMAKPPATAAPSPRKPRAGKKSL